ncbi:HK97 gp10 family phage protein [Pedobacter sp.]|uniref:HK97 gp10 family phage protein n=1 Tax=Pedobacter sp. TaxID=1411316 RepID=UPI003D7FEEDC
MKVSYDSKGDFNNSLKWLNKASSPKGGNIVDQIAKDGVASLMANTPRETGETASGWKSEVKMTAKGMEIVWINTAHPELSVNLAKLIELGHGTRTGGYVSPRPYIKKSMESVFRTAGDKLAGEMFK